MPLDKYPPMLITVITLKRLDVDFPPEPEQVASGLLA
jgi:hypothetical protein